MRECACCERDYHKHPEGKYKFPNLCERCQPEKEKTPSDIKPDGVDEQTRTEMDFERAEKKLLRALDAYLEARTRCKDGQ